MKSIGLVFLLLMNLDGVGQSIGIFAGKSKLPSDYIAIKYAHPSNYIFQFSAQIFMEASKLYGLRYSAYGLDLLTEYTSNQDPSSTTLFSYRLGAGASIQLENEPWLYGGWKASKKIGFGLVGEASGEWAMSSVFSLSAFVQQKILFNKNLGTTRFVFGLGLSYSFNN